MSLHPGISFRTATQSDALCLGVLATQVFLDTYATSGINSDLAHEALQRYSTEIFELRLASSNIEITVAEAAGNLIGFLDLEIESECPAQAVAGPEVFRLYVQAPFQRRGIGQKLLELSEATARRLGSSFIWLTAWVGNTGALAFYPEVGYEDVGETQYIINGKGYENRIFAKALTGVA